ncbi:hypothetical protein D3C71_2147940 [compost metagenome]
MKTIIKVAVIVLRSAGTTTVKKALSGDAPSVRAASVSVGSRRTSAGKSTSTV